MRPAIAVALIGIGLALAAAAPALGQTSGEAAPVPERAESARPAIYKPPPRGAPGGRVGGASRSASLPKVPLPVIELLAPADHAGLSASAAPALYFYVSRPVPWPMQFTVSAPLQAAPMVEATIPSPQTAGIYALPLDRYRARLQPGVDYTWSVAIVVDPHAWSRNIVASAAIEFDPQRAPLLALAVEPSRRAATLAENGLWYDAVAAAVAIADRDGRRTLDGLMRQVGLELALRHAGVPPARTGGLRSPPPIALRQ